MKVKEQLLSLKAYKPGKTIEDVKKEFGLDHITKLASNENPFGCSPLVKTAISKQLDTIVLYPDGYATDLRESLAAYLRVDGSELLFGNGSDDIIQMISRALLSPTDNAVMANPTFPQYRHNAIVEGAEYREVPLIDGEHDLNGMLNQIDDKTKIIWICNPNNPTGIYISTAKLLQFLKSVPKHVLVVLDEAYCEYAQADDYPETIPLLKDYSNLLILRTFSKIYGLASLRIGYGVANYDFIQKIEPIREPFNTNRFAQAAALAALSDQSFIEQCVQKNRRGLEQYYQFCEEQQLKYYPSQGNFILINFNKDGNEIFQYLLERGFIVRSGQALGFPTSIRITIGTEKQNAELIQILKHMLTEK
jgi:histidinol-phosphate aminotransferase